MPWLPHLVDLYRELREANVACGSNLSTTLLLSLMASIALDVPSEKLATHRHLQRDLRGHIYYSGQKVLFTLPRHEYTLTALELVHGHRPLALIDSQQAAAHTLSGNLYGTIINALHQRLGLDSAPSKLRVCLDNNQKEEIPQLTLATLRWCASLMYRVRLDLEEIDTSCSEVYLPLQILVKAFETVAEAIDRGGAPTECFFLFHVLRYYTDELIVSQM